MAFRAIIVPVTKLVKFLKGEGKLFGERPTNRSPVLYEKIPGLVRFWL